MKDRDQEAQPGDIFYTELEEEPAERPARKRLEIPTRANSARSSQARRLRSGPQARRVGEPAIRPMRTRRAKQPGSGLSIGKAISGMVGSTGSFVRELGRHGRSASAQAFKPASLKRMIFRRPTFKDIVALSAVIGTFAVVAVLLTTLPANPKAVVPNATGSIYDMTWTGAGKAPTPRIDYGPYFTTFGPEMIMLGTTGNSTTVWASTDGIEWAQRSGSGSFDVGGRRFVAQGISDDGAGGLVAIGNSLGSNPTDVVAAAFRSRDGGSWTSMPVDKGSGQEMIGGVTAKPGIVVAAGNSVAWLSTDARTWSMQPLPDAANYTLKAVGSWDGGFAIIGLWNGTGVQRAPGSAVWYSPTGRDWIKSPTALDGFDARGIAGSGGHIVAVGTNTGENAPGLASSWSSSDGKTWTEATAPSEDNNVAIDGVTAVNGTFLAYGAPLVIKAPVPASPSPFASESPSASSSAGPTVPGSTLAPSLSESIWVSEDGSAWIPLLSTTPPLGRARMVAVGGNVVMFGRSGGNLAVVTGRVTMGIARKPAEASGPPANYAITLEAGLDPMIVGATKDDELGPVVNSGTRFLAVLTGPVGSAVWSSPTGILWAQEIDADGLTVTGNKGRPVILQAIPDGKGGVLAVGRVSNTSGDLGTIWHMDKSGKWTQAQIQDDAPPQISSIASGPSGFVATSDVSGGSQVLYSTDGDTWQAGSIAVTSGFPLSVASYRYGFVAYGADPAREGLSSAWTSPDGRTWTLRSEWRLPANIVRVFGQGNGLVASAVAIAPPAPASPSPTPVATKASSAKPTAKPKATPVPKPTPTPTPPPDQNKVSWYWSSTGAVWQSTQLTTADGQVAVINGEILVVDVPASTSESWGLWTSGDGKTWLRPAADAFLFKGQRTCGIAAIGDSIVFIGLDGPGQFKDFRGRFIRL
jgi:hypothetical protein